MPEQLLNTLLLRDYRLKRCYKKFIESLKSEAAEEFLELLLKGMSLAFFVSRDYRRNIEGFEARYQFSSKKDGLAVAAKFSDGKLHVKEGRISNPTITINFKDSKALMGFLLSPKPDILQSILYQEITLDGNLNYLYKFAFMAKRLQLTALGQA